MRWVEATITLFIVLKPKTKNSHDVTRKKVMTSRHVCARCGVFEVGAAHDEGDNSDEENENDEAERTEDDESDVDIVEALAAHVRVSTLTTATNTA